MSWHAILTFVRHKLHHRHCRIQRIELIPFLLRAPERASRLQALSADSLMSNCFPADVHVHMRLAVRRYSSSMPPLTKRACVAADVRPELGVRRQGLARRRWHVVRRAQCRGPGTPLRRPTTCPCMSSREQRIHAAAGPTLRFPWSAVRICLCLLACASMHGYSVIAGVAQLATVGRVAAAPRDEL